MIGGEGREGSYKHILDERDGVNMHRLGGGLGGMLPQENLGL